MKSSKPNNTMIVFSLLIRQLGKDKEMIQALQSVISLLKMQGDDVDDLQALIDSLQKDTMNINQRLAPLGVK